MYIYSAIYLGIFPLFLPLIYRSPLLWFRNVLLRFLKINVYLLLCDLIIQSLKTNCTYTMVC